MFLKNILVCECFVTIAARESCFTTLHSSTTSIRKWLIWKSVCNQLVFLSFRTTTNYEFVGLGVSPKQGLSSKLSCLKSTFLNCRVVSKYKLQKAPLCLRFSFCKTILERLSTSPLRVWHTNGLLHSGRCVFALEFRPCPCSWKMTTPSFFVVKQNG